MASSACHSHGGQKSPKQAMDCLPSENDVATTTIPEIEVSDTVSSSSSADRSISGVPSNLYLSPIRPFEPYPGNPHSPVDFRVDAFLNSPTFDLTRVQAVRLAAVLPVSPPPASFVSFDSTPMHHWYQALLEEFCCRFVFNLRVRDAFPVIHCDTDSPTTDAPCTCDDVDAFDKETTAHINAVLTSFNTDFTARYRGSTEGLSIDESQSNAVVAALALNEAASRAESPPKKDWRVGEPLHVEYRRRLRMFEAGVRRMLAEREDLKWLIGPSARLERGVAAYEEYYIAHLRDMILSVQVPGHRMEESSVI